MDDAQEQLKNGADSTVRSVCRYRVKDRKYVVLTLEGAVAARTVHRLSWKTRSGPQNA